MTLENKIVLVTGIGKGIGYEIFKNCVSNAEYTYGITRSKKDYQKLKKTI